VGAWFAIVAAAATACGANVDGPAVQSSTSGVVLQTSASPAIR